MRRILSIVLIIALAVVLFIGGRWYAYVTNTSDPYDEVGIELNRYVPEPLRQWGCDQLQANFAGALPPYGCATGDGSDWI